MNLFTGILKDEPAESYHSKRNYISSSPLPEMAKSPLHFHHKWTNNDESTDAQDKGEFIHKLLLEQDIEKYVARPTKDGRLVASNTKDYAAFLEGNVGKTPIHPDLYNEAMAILTSAISNKRFLKAFEASDKEISFYGRHEETGLAIKARPDMIAKDYSFILDVKSTANIAQFEKQIFSLGYDVRLIHYVETVKAVALREIPEIYFLAIESSAPYGTKMFRLDAEAIEIATIQWKTWMNEIASCQHDEIWPGFPDEIVEVARPKYLQVDSAVSFGGY